MRKQILKALLATSVVLNSQYSYAVPAFLRAWSDVYPESNSDDIGCQLCHQNSTGGNGWNPYGFDVRFYLLEVERNIESAFESVESINSDSDENNLTNLEEIQLSLNPGWVNTNTNTIFFSDFSFLENQVPPFQEATPTNNDQGEVCFTIPVNNDINDKSVFFCL